MHRPLSRSLTVLILALGLVSAGMPAQASELVKLARLVITGKRLGEASLAAPQRAPVEQLPRVLVEGKPTPQTQHLADRGRGMVRPI